MSPRPWDTARRARTMEKIGKEAARAAARLGASGAIVIALYADGEHLHMLDAGKLPQNMSLPDIYRMALSAHAIVADSGGEDVTVQ